MALSTGSLFGSRSAAERWGRPMKGPGKQYSGAEDRFKRFMKKQGVIKKPGKGGANKSIIDAVGKKETGGPGITPARPEDVKKAGEVAADQGKHVVDEAGRQAEAVKKWNMKKILSQISGSLGGAGGGGPTTPGMTFGGGPEFQNAGQKFTPQGLAKGAFRSKELSALGNQYENLRADRMRVADPTMTGATIATAPQDQFRQQQLALSQGLMGQAMGTGPSLAEMNYKRAQERTLSGQLAGAASQRGGRAGLQQLQLQRQAGDINRQAAVDMPMARLAEQQQMAGLASGIAGQARGADIGLATGQAGLTQQASQENLRAALQGQQMKDQFGLAAMKGRGDIASQLMLAKMKRQGLLADQGLAYDQLQAKQGLGYDQLRAEQGLGYDKLRAAETASQREAQWRKYLSDQQLKGAYAQAAGSAIAGGASAMAGS